MKKIILIFTIISVIIISSCGNSANKLIGHWSTGEKGTLSELEFFSDGSYVSSSSNYEGSYSVDSNRIRLNGILVDSLTFTFEVNNNSLILYDNDGDVYGEYSKLE